MHWLSRRMRLEQELAADARGAVLAGGPKRYATILARLALAQDDSRSLWAGRPFFPTRGTLMRRIEMLHHQPAGALGSPARIERAVLLTTLAVAGLAVSGVRGPTRVARAEDAGAATRAGATESERVNDALPPAFDSSYLPANAIAVISVKPLKVGEATTVEPVLNPFPSSYRFAFAMADNGVDEVKTIALAATRDKAAPSMSKDAIEPGLVEIYRMRKPYKRGTLRSKIFGEAPDGVTETTCLGYPCLRALSDSGHLVNYLLVNDRTLVILRDRDVPKVLAANAQSHPSWHDDWQEIADSPLALACDSAAMAAIEGKPEDTGDAQDKFIRSMLHETTFIFAHVACTSGELKVSVKARSASPEKAQAATEVVRGGAAAAIAALTTARQIFERSAMPKEFQSIDVAGGLLSTLSSLKTVQQGIEAQAEAKFDSAFITHLAEATKAFLSRQSEEYNAREKEDEKTHIAKLGRLAKALEAYRAARGHYPTAAVVGPDGKTTHSWRVALLPYLGEQKLFDEYKLGEPWDSEHNKRLVEKIPNIYTTSQWSGKGEAEYYVVTGEGTLFDAGATDSISDAPGDTILVLQSRQHVPWTKPVDIETTADHNPTRPFRGNGKGFYAAFADGTVKFVSKETDAATVRALFTKAGGEEIKLR